LWILEDTRIGSIVLEADKRFKTISSGLDPTSFADLRNDIRTYAPALPPPANVICNAGYRVKARGGSVGGTRFWYTQTQ